jgi:hypothetical protein
MFLIRDLSVLGLCELIGNSRVSQRSELYGSKLSNIGLKQSKLSI